MIRSLVVTFSVFLTMITGRPVVAQCEPALSLAVVHVGAGGGATQWAGNGHWYEARQFEEEIPWLDAKAFCESLGGHLTTITSGSESAFVWSNIVPTIPPMPNNGQGPMLGGWKVSGSWQWITGEPWSYTNWCPVEPTGDGPYLQIWRFAGPCWNDYNGNHSRSVLIEWSADCNNDGVVDYGQILTGDLVDADVNGIPDCCEVGSDCDCDADIIVDGVVDHDDLMAVLGMWGPCGTPCPADFNLDGTIGLFDLVTVLAAWGPCN